MPLQGAEVGGPHQGGGLVDDQVGPDSPASASGFSQRGTHSGAWSGSCLCQKPLDSAPLGKRCMLSARWAR